MILLIIVFVFFIMFKSCKAPKNNIKIEYKKNSKKIITLYHATWCKHCQNLLPLWNNMIKDISTNNIIIRDVEVSELDNEPEYIKNMITGFPTVIMTPDNKSYIGEKEIVDLLNYIKDTSNNFDISDNQDISNNYQDTITLYYAEWCPYSRMFLPFWLDMKIKFNDNNIPIKLVEIEESDMSENIVENYPTAVRSSDGSQYIGKNNIMKLLTSYVDNQVNTNNQVNVDNQINTNNQVENNIIYDDNNMKKQQINNKIFNQQIANQNLIMNNEEPLIIRPMDNETMNNLMSRQKSNLFFIYSINCSYCRMILPKWHKFVAENNNKYNITEVESTKLNQYPNLINQIDAFPTLILNQNKYVGYDEINNILNNL